MSSALEVQVKRQLLTELIQEISNSIKQYERTVEGLRQRIEIEQHRRDYLVQKCSEISENTIADDDTTIASCIVRVLSAHGTAMHIHEIVRALMENGVSTKSENGPKNSVVSALSRRDDLFYKVQRGRYALRQQCEHLSEYKDINECNSKGCRWETVPR